MCREELESKSIREFVDSIMQTEIVEAKGWVEEFLKVVPGWSLYSDLAITKFSVEHIAFGISSQICRQLKNLHYNLGQPWLELAQKGHKFLQEIHQKATEIGLEVDLDKIDWILEPETAKSR